MTRDPFFDEKRHGSRLTITRRGFVFCGVQLAVAGALAMRLRELQIVEAKHYRFLAEENRINTEVVAPARASIFDRNGNPLAINNPNYQLEMVREEAGDAEAVLDRLWQLVDVPEHQRLRVWQDIHRKQSFVPVGIIDHLGWEEFARINANAPALPGIRPKVGFLRHYPHGRETAHVVGYVGRVTQRDLDRIEKSGRKPDVVLSASNFQIGKTALERALDEPLRGEAGTRQIEVNAHGRIVREIDRFEGTAGENLHLTLDLELQNYCLARLGGEAGSVVVMDVISGDLLAIVSSPSYDPNSFVLGIGKREYGTLLEDDRLPLHNKWAAGMYPPGSTFKMVVGLAALQAERITPKETVFCPGHLDLGERRFHCWRRGGHGSVGLKEAIERSCDVYFYDVARRVGIEKIGQIAPRPGLGVTPDLPIADMLGGLIPTKARKRRERHAEWLVGDTLNAGIGQGFVLATPVQLAVMTARLASGTGVKPRLIRARSGRLVASEPLEDLGMDPAHLEQVRHGMFDAVNAARGTARGVRIADEAFRMAGKTGTSQVRNITAAERASGVYRNEDLPWRRRDHALFIGYAPAENPRYAVAVVVEHGGSGSEAAAPIARDVLMHLRDAGLVTGDNPSNAKAPT